MTDGPKGGRMDVNGKPLTERAVLVDLSISMWGASAKDKYAGAVLADLNKARPDALGVTKRLIAKEALADLREVVKGAKTRHLLRTLPWDDKGTRMIPVERVQDYLAMMDRCVDEMAAARTWFLAEYAEHVDRAKKDLGDLFEADDYPMGDDLRKKIGISWEIRPVPDRTHFAAGLLGEDEERIRADVERRSEERIRLAVTDLFEQLGKATARLADRMGMDRTDAGQAKERQFRDTVVSNLREAAERARTLDVTGNDLLAELSSAALALVDGVEPKTLRPTSGGGYDKAARKKLEAGAAELASRFAGYVG